MDERRRAEDREREKERERSGVPDCLETAAWAEQSLAWLGM
jgi:hypothetical protein